MQAELIEKIDSAIERTKKQLDQARELKLSGWMVEYLKGRVEGLEEVKRLMEGVK